MEVVSRKEHGMMCLIKYIYPLMHPILHVVHPTALELLLNFIPGIFISIEWVTDICGIISVFGKCLLQGVLDGLLQVPRVAQHCPDHHHDEHGQDQSEVGAQHALAFFDSPKASKERDEDNKEGHHQEDVCSRCVYFDVELILGHTGYILRLLEKCEEGWLVHKDPDSHTKHHQPQHKYNEVSEEEKIFNQLGHAALHDVADDDAELLLTS